MGHRPRFNVAHQDLKESLCDRPVAHTALGQRVLASGTQWFSQGCGMVHRGASIRARHRLVAGSRVAAKRDYTHSPGMVGALSGIDFDDSVGNALSLILFFEFL